jgi:5'-nucleotidase
MIVYIDMDDVLCDYAGARARALAARPDVAFPQSEQGFYLNLLPLEGALAAASALLDSPCISAFILTAPSVRNPLCYTEKRLWVEKHLGLRFAERLILCPDKSLLRGDVLIDDRISGHGQERFIGKLIEFGSQKFPDWRAVLAELGI